MLIDPCVPPQWREFKLRYRAADTVYDIVVENPHGVSRGVVQLELDGKILPGASVPLQNDAGPHRVRVTMGPPGARASSP
jgi:cyclic beta-1,2-glucan synthetase